MRKALVVGIDHYSHIGDLYGCVNDAHSVKAVLERHSDGSVNFGVELHTASGAGDPLSRGTLKKKVTELFRDDCDVSLFYFAGHGHIEATGGYLCASDCQSGDDGLALGEILTIINTSPAKNKILILDSCHSGIAGTPPGQETTALKDGTTILTASTQDQYANEKNGSGVFTTLLVNALSGAAGNLVGDVTPGSIYAHIDQSLGPWKQRPVFKTNVKTFVSLRKVQPPIPTEDLRRIVEFFPVPGFLFQLDPSYEPELNGRPAGSAPPDPANTLKFAVLQKFNRVNLVVPEGAPHMWHAAMESKTCRLTVLGEHYRNLVAEGLL